MKIKNFKNFFVAFAVSQLFFFTIGCGESVKPADEPNNKVALEEIKKEPKIKEAFITEANVLYVSVEDDGTNRNGYAEYLCGILKENKASTSWVKIVKVNSIDSENSDNAYGVLLGESMCN
jgi:hypothetical protein